MRRFVLAAVLSCCVAGPPPAVAQDAELSILPKVPVDYQPARTPWGEPDLRGSWPIDHLNGTPLQRDPKQGDRVFLTDEELAQRARFIEGAAKRYEVEDQENKIGMGHWAEMGEVSRRTSFIVDPPNGRLPELTAEGKRLSAAMRSSWRKGQVFDWVTDFDSWDRCITRGMPASMFPFQYNNGIRIFQAPGVVAINMEMVHETRIIPTDGRPGIPSKVRHWLGESRGRWENGNTLVVETTNLRPGASATNVGTIGSPPENDMPISEQARIVERFTMTAPDRIVYEMTYADPVVFAAPWTARLDWKRDGKYEMFEYACHEGNVQVRNYISASRAERAQKSGGSQ